MKLKHIIPLLFACSVAMGNSIDKYEAEEIYLSLDVQAQVDCYKRVCTPRESEIFFFKQVGAIYCSFSLSGGYKCWIADFVEGSGAKAIFHALDVEGEWIKPSSTWGSGRHILQKQVGPLICTERLGKEYWPPCESKVCSKAPEHKRHYACWLEN